MKDRQNCGAGRIRLCIGILALLTSAVLAPASAQEAGKDQKVREYLEQFRLEDLLVEQTSAEQGRWTARIKDSSGKQHTVRLGSYVGRNDGRIFAIDAEGIRIMEIVPDNLGGWREREVVLRKGVSYEEPRVALRRRYAAPVNTAPVQSEFVAAASRGHTDRLAALVQRGADLNAVAGTGKDTALAAAVLKNRIDTVSWLVRNGAKLDSFVGSKEETPLILSAMLGNAEMAKLLLEAGADPNLSDLSEHTALGYAASEGNVQITNVLLARHADPTLWSKYGVSPITAAAAGGHLEIVKRFLAAGVGLETRDRNGHTMLAAASDRGRAQVVRFLIGAGAELNSTNNFGQTVLDLGVASSNDEIVELLTSGGARPAIAPELIGYWANVEPAFANWWVVESGAVINYGGQATSGKCLKSYASIKGPNRIDINFGNTATVDISASNGKLLLTSRDRVSHHKRVDKKDICRKRDGSYYVGAPIE